MRKIRHIVLTTGDERESTSRDVSSEGLEIVKDMIERVLAGDSMERHPIPRVEGYSISGIRTRKSLTLAITSDAPLSIIAGITVAADGQGAEVVWKDIHRVVTTPRATSPNSPPVAPWCALTFESGLLQHFDAVQWLRELEDTIAHAWLEMQIPVTERATL